MPRWYRSSTCSDFYACSQLGIPDLRVAAEYECFYFGQLPPRYDASVKFINFKQGDPIKSIAIGCQSTGAVEIRIESEVDKEKLLAPFIEYIGTLNLQIDIVAGRDPEEIYKTILYCRTPLLASHLLNNLVSSKYGLVVNLLGVDLLEEMALISECVLYPDFFQTDKGKFKHKIPEIPKLVPAIVNRKDSQLADLLKEYSGLSVLPENAYCQFIFMLTQHADANQFDLYGLGSSVVHAVAYYSDLRILEHLLYYGADPTLRLSNGFYHDSAIDIALRLGMYDKLSLIDYAANPIEHPIKLKIKNHHVKFANQAIQTTIDLYEKDDPSESVVKTLKTELKHRSAVKDDGLALLKMGLDVFQLNLSANNQESSGKKNDILIEVIKDKNDEIVGFTLFEIIYRGEDMPIYWFCSLSYISLDYRKSGIMSVLSLQNACALQMIFPDNVIGVFYLSIDPNSYRQVKNFKFWPMLQPDYLETEVKYLVHRIDPAANYFHDQLTCYVDNRVTLKEKKNNSNFRDDFFFKYILKQPNKNSSGKAAPVLVHVSDHFYQAYSANCDKLGWSLDKHLDQLAHALQDFIQYWKLIPRQRQGHIPKNCIKNGYQLFFNNKVVTSKEVSKLSYLDLAISAKL